MPRSKHPSRSTEEQWRDRVISARVHTTAYSLDEHGLFGHHAKSAMTTNPARTCVSRAIALAAAQTLDMTVFGRPASDTPVRAFETVTHARMPAAAPRTAVRAPCNVPGPHAGDRGNAGRRKVGYSLGPCWWQ